MQALSSGTCHCRGWRLPPIGSKAVFASDVVDLWVRDGVLRFRFIGFSVFTGFRVFVGSIGFVVAVPVMHGISQVQQCRFAPEVSRKILGV